MLIHKHTKANYDSLLHKLVQFPNFHYNACYVENFKAFEQPLYRCIDVEIYYILKSEETVKLQALRWIIDLISIHIFRIFCKRAATQLNVLTRLKVFIGFKEKQILVQSFVYIIIILIIVLWCGIVHLQSHYRKLNSYKNAL